MWMRVWHTKVKLHLICVFIQCHLSNTSKTELKQSWRSMTAILCFHTRELSHISVFRDLWAVFCLFLSLNKVRMYSHNLASLGKHFRLLKCSWNECQIQFRLEQIPQDSGSHRFKQIPGSAMNIIYVSCDQQTSSVQSVWHLHAQHQYTAGNRKHFMYVLQKSSIWGAEIIKRMIEVIYFAEITSLSQVISTLCMAEFNCWNKCIDFSKCVVKYLIL